MELKIVKVKGKCHWAIKSTINGVSRYRGYYYKKDAEREIREWQLVSEVYFKSREFIHNFDSAENLGIKEADKCQA